MKKPKAILFDWDNTLVDTWPTINIAIREMLEGMSMNHIKIDDLGPSNHLSAKDLLPQIFGDQWPKANLLYKEAYKKYQFDNLKLLIGAQKVLDFLRMHCIYMALVSNKLGSILREEVSFLGLSSYFTEIVGSLDAENDKPSKDSVIKALGGSKIKPDKDVWLVGDSLIDVQCAINAGCAPIFIGGIEDHNVREIKEVKIVNDHNDFFIFLNKYY